VALTDEQISALDACVEEFQAANYKCWEKFVKDLLGSFDRACPQGVEFEEATMRTVHI
jgi:hypothetical protein